jgi:hypothetical protein
MSVEKKSRRQNVKKRRPSSSKDAPSANSVSKKSKPSNGKTLRVATPTDSALRVLANAGLVVPDDLDPGEEHVPLDFTQPSSAAIGALHSRFAVRHSHALFVQARTATDLAVVRHELRQAEAIYRARHGDDHGAKWKLDTEMARSKRIGKLRNRVTELEIQLELVKAVTDGYEDLRNAASREMFRRDSERPARD